MNTKDLLPSAIFPPDALNGDVEVTWLSVFHLWTLSLIFNVEDEGL